MGSHKIYTSVKILLKPWLYCLWYNSCVNILNEIEIKIDT
jgi:hypothetical protein